MTLKFTPKPGCVLFCDFRGYIAPEMIKKRPVVVISPAHLRRPGLFTVVPLSTTAPNPVCEYHYKLRGNPMPWRENVEMWAKCDMVATVCFERLDRFRVSRGNYKTGAVGMDQVKAIRRAAMAALGVDLNNTRTYN